MPIRYLHPVWSVLTFILVEWNCEVAIDAAISGYITVPVPKRIYKSFCDEELLYRPYIKTYKGRREAVRTGVPDKTFGPGFHKEFLAPEMENTYVCVNGLAWLYYSVTTRKATVYQTPRLHKFVHHCFMANGVPGPGPHEEFKTLLAVLLVGNRKDYRRPSAQLFPAPYKNITVTEVDATSVFVIGEDSECILMKGDPPTEFRVRNDNGAKFPSAPGYKLRRRRFIDEDIYGLPHSLWKRKETPDQKKARLEKAATTVFCKLSYTNLKNNLKDTSYLPLAFELLKNTPPIKLKGCWRPDNYTQNFQKYCEAQTTIYKDIEAGKGKWGILYAELKEMSKYLTALGVNAQNAKAADPCATTGACEETKMQKEIDVKIQNSKNKPDNEKLKVWMNEILPIILRNYASRLFKAVELMKKAVAAASAAYTDAGKVIGDALKEKEKVDKAMEALVEAKTNAEAAAAGGTRDPAKEKIVVEKQEDLTDAELVYMPLSRDAQASLSAAETANQTVNGLLMKGFVKNEYVEYVNAYKQAAAKTQISLVPADLDPIPFSVTLTIKMPATEAGELKEDKEEDDKTAFEKDKEADKTCGRLPSPRDTCQAATPEKGRACLLLKAKLNRKAPKSGEWSSKDEWRQELMDLVSDIFVQMTPRGTISNPKGYVNSVNLILKAYLTNYIPALGPTTSTTPPTMNPRRPFYDQILVALKGCKEKETVLQFDKRDGRLILLKKVGKRVKRLLVEENYEQADDEYVFNWAIDNMWFMFTSVLGICMPAYEYSIPLISSKFYSYYTEDFLYPVAKEWVSNRDNHVLRLIFGEWYKNPWPKRIMEASFVHSGDLRFRPPRKMFVNDLTEGNFFTAGPLKGTAGIYHA